MMLVALCIPFPFSTPCDAMLTMLICATHWLSMHLYMLAYMSMHKSCLLVCCPCFNIMKLWTFDPNLHLSLADTTFCLLSCLLVSFLAFFPFLLCLPCLSSLFALRPFLSSLYFFLPLLVCWFLVLAFTCTHTERGRMELRHGLPGTSKKGEGTSLSI